LGSLGTQALHACRCVEMTSILETAGDAVTGAVSDAGQAIASAFAQHPLVPPPPPLQPPPLEPPPDEPPAPPLIICPPMAPPPLSPPSFQVWSQQVPTWFWLTFVFTVLVACIGTIAIVYTLREVRRMRRGERLPAIETAKSLAQLEARMTTRGY